MEYTESEKLLLKMLFNIVDSILLLQGGYLDLTAQGLGYMNEKEIYDLRDKLGVED